MSYPPPPPPPPGYGQQPGYPQQQPYGIVAVGPETHSNAIISLILGIVGITSCSILTGIPALILGYKARGEIDAAPTRYTGRGMAVAGIITGWISIGLCVGGGLFYVLFLVLFAASGGGS